MRSATGAMEGMSAYVAHAAAASSEVLQVKECTKHNSTVKYTAQPTYQWCTTQGRTALKNAISVLMSGYTV